MTFGEKLFKLRKEKGLSQEALAEKLNTPRQAVSKWENGQGYPETEKLLRIGDVFGVSMDYLLKDSVEPSNDQQAGYYVSKEMGEGYLLYSRKSAKYLSLGLFFVILAFIPYFVFNQNPSAYLIPSILLATIGVGLLASTSFFEEEEYKVLKQEPLMFDEKYLKELAKRYELLKKKYTIFMVFGFVSFAVGFLPIGLERKNFIADDFLTPYYPICIGLIALGTFILANISSILEAYKLLVKNDVYINRFGFKFRTKMRKKFEEF